MNRFIALIALTAVVALLPAPTDAIYCWQCNSAADKMCADVPQGPVRNVSNLSDCFKKYYVECPEKEGKTPFCRKQVQTIQNTDTRIIRDCAYEKDNLDLYKVKSPSVLIVNSQCHTDGCNGAMNVVSSLFVLVGSFLAVRLFQ